MSGYTEARNRPLEAWRHRLEQDGWTAERIDALLADNGVDDKATASDIAEQTIDKAERWLPRAVSEGMNLTQIERALRNLALPESEIHRLTDQAADLATDIVFTATEPPTTIPPDADAPGRSEVARCP